MNFDLALTYASDAYDVRTKMMGRQSTGAAFLKAIAKSGPQRIWCYAVDRNHAEMFARDFYALGPRSTEIRFIPWHEPARLAISGLLYRPDPGLIDGGWRRQAHGGARAWSICGVTHTLSSHAAMTALKGILTAPVYPWDAVVCTSRVAKNLVRNILESEMDHLRGRLGSVALALPQFPVIPLGIHLDEFKFTAKQRAAARAQLGLGTDDVAVLFAGRLTFHGKGHPLPMFMGLELAAGETRKSVALVLFGQFANTAVEEVFRQEATRFAPSIRLIILDGKSEQDRISAWSGADFFTSLSDNIQETFGLTPIEAMAAGLPVVVSDWDGYKDTVRDGIDGFRVPTLMASPDTGKDLADRYDAGTDDYDRYIGQVSLYTSVDYSAAASAYARLISDGELRQRMGQAGRKRAEEIYSWDVVFRSYMRLWEELAERRRSDPIVPGEHRRSRRPDRQEPFTLFRSFATTSIDNTTIFSLSPGASIDEAAARLKLRSVSYAPVLPNVQTLERLVTTLGRTQYSSFNELQDAITDVQRWELERALLWLTKMGLLIART